MSEKEFLEKFYDEYKTWNITILHTKEFDDFILTYKFMKMECEDQNKSMEKIYEIINKHIDIA